VSEEVAMQRVFRVVNTAELKPVGIKSTGQFNRSVRRYGVLNPVLLAEVVDADGAIELAIIDGHRRVRAARSARLPKIPAVVLKATTKQDRARLTLLCNSMRSANFHTESAAILALAADEDAAAGAARAIGLGPVKVQQLYRKISTMPEPVRNAMYEHRIPVTAASWVGAWPEGLQREVVDLLARRRYVNTTMLKDLREWYAERHPEEFAVAAPATEDVPFDEWSDTSLHVVNIPAPPAAPVDNVDGGGVRSPSGEACRVDVHAPPGDSALPLGAVPDATHLGAQHVEVANIPTDPAAETLSEERGDSGSMESLHVEHSRKLPTVPSFAVHPAETMPMLSDRPPLVSANSSSHGPSALAPLGPPASLEPAGLADAASAAGPGTDDRAERMVAFVVRLDAALREFAREACELGIDRSIWVDRSMRAWDGIGG
jgi:ParB/RepB/Spo0J family partition protein